MPDDPDETAKAEDGTVLTPDELDITSEDNVVEIDEGRYVISPGGTEPNVNVPDQPTQSTDSSGRDAGEPSGGNAEVPSHPNEGTSSPNEVSPRSALSEDDVHDWLESRLDAADSKFAFDVTARFEGAVTQRALFSNDVVTTFENLVVWYATHAGSDTPVEDVLGILLTESNLTIRFPHESLRAFTNAHGLDDEDSIGDLFSVVRESGGVRFPPDGS